MPLKVSRFKFKQNPSVIAGVFLCEKTMLLDECKTSDWPHNLTMRRALPDDEGFYYRLTHEVMFEHIVQTWGDWDADITWQNAQNFAQSSDGWVMLVDGWAAGLIDIMQREADLFIVDLYVLPEHQKQGIGRHVMQCLISLGQPIRLGVLRVNQRAQAFYQRLGFVVERMDERYFYMLLQP